jgi:NADH dehydrogenase
MTQSWHELTRPRIVIVGAGFGALSAAKALSRMRAEVIVIDRNNYHLFQPLLYQVATAGLSPADIASPIRSILRGQENTSVMLAKVTGVNVEGRRVLTGKDEVPYDFLVLATGARHDYFGHDEWEQHAQGIKKIEDATALRRKILIAFEKAEIERDPAERRRLLNFVIVGGGPTGVEIAGAIAELARKALARDFRTIDPRQARIILVHAGTRLLPSFDERLSEAARRSLEMLGVEVELDAAVTDCDALGVSVGTVRIGSRTVIWAAGVCASQPAKWLESDKDRFGRVKTLPDLTVPGYPEIFAIGDTAHVAGRGGDPLPGTAAVAKQQGAYVARAIAARLEGRDPPAFAYRDLGAMATIGRKRAIAELGKLRLSGALAWLLWSVAHIYFLIGFRNRLAVVLNWGWNYVTFHRGTRLITGPEPESISLNAVEAPRTVQRVA